MRCGSSGGCPNSGPVSGQIYVHNASVTLSDGSSPGVTLTGGTLLSGGWKGGTQSVVVDATDNIGIAEASVLVDGVKQGRTPRSCSYGQKVPCSSGATSLQVPTAGLADGPHTVQGEAVDASGNAGQSASATVYIDNTPPTQPLDLQLTGGAGWRADNAFELSWRDPSQSFAPIAGAAYQLCPSTPQDADQQTKAKAQAKCVLGSRTGLNLTAIKDLKLPGPGLWDLKLWLVDSAGSQQPASAAEVDGLGFDDTPPTGVAFVGQDPQDPARVHVQADDSVSGLASGVDRGPPRRPGRVATAEHPGLRQRPDGADG